jgi:hypothetical protein
MEDKLADKKTTFCIGMLEFVKVLLEEKNQEVLSKNIKHIIETIPIAIRQIRDNDF